MGHPEKDGPGDVPPDPARRPGQPGAERDQVDDTPESEAPVPPGAFDERQIPLDRVRRDAAPSGDPDEPAPDPAPLSDGSMKAGPV